MKTPQKIQAQSVRIIGGRFRGKRIPFPDIEGLRPTPDRVRETVFNWLQREIIDARCLDAFAGSGILGFECLSRGAQSVTWIEQHPKILESLARTQADYRVSADQMRLHKGSFFEIVQMSHIGPFDLVFLDPPYHQHLLLSALDSLMTHAHILSRSAKIYVEMERSVPLSELLGHIDTSAWRVAQLQTAGQVMFGLIERIA